MANIDDIAGPCSTAHLLRRQGVTYETLMDCLEVDRCQDMEIIEEVEIQIKYSGYIKRQLQQIGRFKQLETRAIPSEFPYDHVMGFSNEVREKLKRVRPASIGQASRISGVTPAAISVLLVALTKYKGKSVSP
jgi:tRNA uridine 5-carboxymethylaminomethyl modification enzyme